MKNINSVFYELNVSDTGFGFLTSTSDAMNQAVCECRVLDEKIKETDRMITSLTPQCDKVDYALAASTGILCGMIDIFLVGKPGESPLGNITDKWFEERVKDFAKLFCRDKDNSTLEKAIRNLEHKFKIPYDQRGAGDVASSIFGLTPGNHHFKSLAHNPTLLGLFFSILDQFTNQSHFISNGEMIVLQQADNNFELRGTNILSKFFCAFINWIGHLTSDVSGASGSKGRGTGIPSPFLAWSNDVIALKRALKLPVSEIDKKINELALMLFKKGFDTRFQATQMIPVIMNELIVRFIYMFRRTMFVLKAGNHVWSIEQLWMKCEPFSNASVKRMLTIAHGTFCILDLGDATIRGIVAGKGSFNPIEFFLRVNIAGVGRFTISLLGEGKRYNMLKTTQNKRRYIQHEKQVEYYYIQGLKVLQRKYNDQYLIQLIENLINSHLYADAFNQSIVLAKKRNVPKEILLKNKRDIDRYFLGN